MCPSSLDWELLCLGLRNHLLELQIDCRSDQHLLNNAFFAVCFGNFDCSCFGTFWNDCESFLCGGHLNQLEFTLKSDSDYSRTSLVPRSRWALDFHQNLHVKVELELEVSIFIESKACIYFLFNLAVNRFLAHTSNDINKSIWAELIEEAWHYLPNVCGVQLTSELGELLTAQYE